MLRFALIATLPLAGCALETMATEPGAPSQPAAEASSFRVEIDVLEGVDVNDTELASALETARDAFASANVHVAFDVSRLELAAPARLVARQAKSELLLATRDVASAVHVVIAARGAGAHGVVHYEDGEDARRGAAGVLIFAGSVADDYAANPMLAEAGIERDRLLGRSMAHELGHALGCPHPSEGASDRDPAEVMTQNSQLGAINDESLPRWRRALLEPRFTRDCLDLGARLSVELARPSYSK